MSMPESWLSKNLFSVIPLILSLATAVGASYAMQARHDERINNNERTIARIEADLKTKVDQREMAELKDTLDEVREDIKKLLISSGNGH